MSETSFDELIGAHEAVAPDRWETVPKHEPKAAILACSDARVPPSVVFDQPAGNLFVVRIAGNTAVPSALASLDYAVDILGVDLIVVMGHTNCGAVAAAAAGTCGGHLAPIVAPVCEIARANPQAEPDQLAELNVLNTIEVLRRHDGPVGEAARQGCLEIRGVIHDVTTCCLQPLPISSPTKPNPAPSLRSQYS